MRLSLFHLLAASLLSLLSLGNTAITDPNTFDQLLDSLGDLGYGKAATTFGPLKGLTASNITGAGSPCTRTCNLLSTILPNLTSQIGSPSYTQQEAAYWSNQQAETQPTCRIQPQSALDVSVSLLITRFFQCPFAVKSGGHAMFAGASNIQDGLTIDLANLNQIQVSEDKTLTHVGAGNRWVDVYSQLDQQQLSVIGGRVAGIGVGGLTLGGTLHEYRNFRKKKANYSQEASHSSPVVTVSHLILANTRIINVNHTSYPDLYFALRGGGNNFGIVTRFTLETFPQGPMWGGSRSYPISANASLIGAFDTFATANNDPDAAVILNFYYYNGTFGCNTDIEYAQPTINPPVLHQFTAIASTTSTMRITNLTDLVLELGAANPMGFRETYYTATFKPDARLEREILETYISEVEGIKDALNILPSVTMQPLTRAMISHFSKNGGNALGIAEADGPLNLVDLSISWSCPCDDERIMAAGASFIDRTTAAAKALGLDYRFIYQNYAAKGQDVFEGYGEGNKRRLVEISEKYDPEQVFQKLQPGYFKLNG